jgi:lipid II:glycine glycyltransferase (peptidoglycan interpeptide bridge formation enzyme)
MKFDECSVETAYEIVSTNRKNKGLRMSLEIDYFQKMLNTEKNIVSGYRVNYENSELSAAILIKVTENYSYVYAWGHNQNIPMGGTSLTFLAANIILELGSRGMEDISLGVSSIFGKIDHGLFKFKESLGAKVEEIIVLEY